MNYIAGLITGASLSFIYFFAILSPNTAVFAILAFTIFLTNLITYLWNLR